MRRAALIAFAAALVCSVAGGLAQTIEGVDLDAARRRAAAQARDAEGLAAEVARRGEALRADAETVRDASLARVRALDPRRLPGPTGPVDFDAIVAAAGTNLDAGRGSAPLVLAFASLSMPAESLRPLIRDMARAGGVVVFRGFPGNSARTFVAGLGRSVANDADLASIAIDPRLFRAFDVRAVPTYVVASTDFELCDGLACRTAPPPFDVLAGNVTTEHALSTIAEGGGPGARVARLALANLARERR